MMDSYEVDACQLALAGPSTLPHRPKHHGQARKSSKSSRVHRSTRLASWLAATALLSLSATANAAPSPTHAFLDQFPPPTPTSGSAQTPASTVGTVQALGRSANVVDLVICILSTVGSLIIMIPYIFQGGTRKLRYSLIFGLASSDFVTSINITITTIYLLAGGNLSMSRGFCTAFGFFLSVGLYTTHFWNLCILIITYMILVHPLSTFTLAIERRVLWLWPIIWSIAIIINAPVFPTAGFGFSGGYCYISTNREPALFANLYSFIPRALVVGCILVLYTRLFFFLRRANIFSNTSARQSSLTGPSSHRSLRRGTAPAPLALDAVGKDESELNGSSIASVKAYLPFVRRGSSATGGANPHVRSSGNALETKSANVGGSSDGFSMPLEMKHYAFGAPVSGAGLTRQDADPMSSPTDTRLPLLKVSPTTLVAPDSLSSKEGEEDEDDYVEPVLPLRNQRSRSLGDLTRDTPELGWSKGSPTTKLATLEERPKTADTPAVSVPPTIRRASAGRLSGLPASGLRPILSRRGTTTVREEMEGEDNDEFEDDDDVPNYHEWAGLTRMKPRSDAGDFKMISAPREHLRHYNIPPHMQSHLRVSNLASNGGSSPETMPPSSLRRTSVASVRSQRRPSNVVIAMPDESDYHRQQLYENVMSDDWAWGTNVTSQGSQDYGRPGSGVADAIARRFRRKSSVANGAQNRRNTETSAAIADGRSVGHSRRSTLEAHGVGASRATTSSGSDEQGVDSMGSTLNRQASALLLLYPLAYMILFSLSMARIIRDFATDRYVTHTKDALHNIARWMIFAQGLMDCVIFKVIERYFQLRMKRKRARHHGETRELSWEEKTLITVGKFFKRNWSWAKEKRRASSLASEKRSEEKRASRDAASAAASAAANNHANGSGIGHTS